MESTEKHGKKLKDKELADYSQSSVDTNYPFSLRERARVRGSF